MYERQGTARIWSPRPEQGLRNQQVTGSNPIVGSNRKLLMDSLLDYIEVPLFRCFIFRTPPLLRHFFGSDMSQLEVFREATAAMPAYGAMVAGNPRSQCPEMHRKNALALASDGPLRDTSRHEGTRAGVDPAEIPEIRGVPTVGAGEKRRGGRYSAVDFWANRSASISRVHSVSPMTSGG